MGQKVPASYVVSKNVGFTISTTIFIIQGKCTHRENYVIIASFTQHWLTYIRICLWSSEQRLQELVTVQGRVRQPILRHSQLRKLVINAGLDLDEDELQQVGSNSI